MLIHPWNVFSVDICGWFTYMWTFGHTETIPCILGAHGLVEMFQSSCCMRDNILPFYRHSPLLPSFCTSQLLYFMLSLCSQAMEALTVVFITVSLKHPECMCYVSVIRQWSSMRICRGSLGLFNGTWGLPWWLSAEETACQCRKHRFDTWVKKIPLRRKWQPTPEFLPGKSHRQRSLVG